ncbi:hypothetical protein ES703_45532 [subsurface metagenome]
MQMLRHHHTLEDGKVIKQGGQLKAPSNPPFNQLVWFKASYILAFIEDLSLCRWVKPGDYVKERCFAGTIGANQSRYFSLVDIKAQSANGG